MLPPSNVQTRQVLLLGNVRKVAMEREIFASSAKLVQISAKKQRNRFEPDCARLQIGQSFSVGTNEIKGSTLKPMISRLAKKLEMKLRVVEHKEHNCYEIGRIA